MSILTFLPPAQFVVVDGITSDGARNVALGEHAHGYNRPGIHPGQIEQVRRRDGGEVNTGSSRRGSILLPRRVGRRIRQRLSRLSWRPLFLAVPVFVEGLLLSKHGLFKVGSGGLPVRRELSQHDGIHISHPQRRRRLR